MSTNENQADLRASQNRHRRLRSYFVAAFQDLRETVHAVSTDLTFQDAETILTSLAEHLDSYKGPDVRAQAAFTKWASTWIRLVARLILTVREMTPALIEAAQSASPGLTDSQYRTAVNRVERHVPELLRDDAPSLLIWASEWVTAEARGLKEWPKWAECKIIRRSIYKGLWRCLSQCADLGLGESDQAGRNPVVESLASDALEWMYENAGDLAKGPVPVGARMREKAYWLAKAWKTEQLRADNRFVSLDVLDRVSDNDDEIAAGELEGRDNLLEILQSVARLDDPNAIPIETEEEITAA